MSNLFIIEGQGCGSDVRGADAGGLANTKEVGKGEKGETGGVSIGNGVQALCQCEEEIWGGPKLGWGWGGQALERFGESPMIRYDNGREEGEGFQLPDGRDETTGADGGASAGDHVMKGGREGITVG